MIDGFMDEEEAAAAALFEHQHYHWCRKAFSVDRIGRHKGFTYHLHQTGIGLNIVVECCECRTKEDISDYDAW